MTQVRTAVFTALVMMGSTAGATEFERTYDFALDEWHEINDQDGPVTLHRIRINPKEGRVTRSSVLRPFNSEYLETVQIQLEFTNESDSRWRAQISLRWLDSEGRVIDGFTGNEVLGKGAARRITQISVPTLKYGLEVADKLEVGINYEP